MSFSLRDSLELSSAADFNISINSAVPRWQRKALQSQTPGKSLQGTSSKTPTADRFIPNRTANSSFEVAAVKASVEEALASEADGSTFHSFLASNLLPGETSGVGESLSGSRVLAFKSKAPGPAEGHINTLSTLYTSNKGGGGKIKTYRHIPSAPERILDAPALVDDYYLKLLDWSSSNTLAVALGPTVYLWNAGSGSISELCTLPSPEDYVSSVAWIKEGGQHLAIGTASAEVQLWDCERSRQVRSMKGHAGRVGALDWNSHILSSGSRDAAIFNHDVRIRDHHVSSLLHHTQEVCGLKWSPDGTLLASGGNDNTLCIWDAASSGGGGG